MLLRALVWPLVSVAFLCFGVAEYLRYVTDRFCDCKASSGEWADGECKDCCLPRRRAREG